MSKVIITKNKAQQFNKMLASLKRISEGYVTLDRLKNESNGNYRLGFEKEISMAYENIRSEAKRSLKNVKFIKINQNKLNS